MRRDGRKVPAEGQDLMLFYGILREPANLMHDSFECMPQDDRNNAYSPLQCILASRVSYNSFIMRNMNEPREYPTSTQKFISSPSNDLPSLYYNYTYNKQCQIDNHL
jgi:hypothetical protein